jgi:hypothetical protein
VSTVYYKATTPNATSFYDPSVRWEVGATVAVSESARKRSAECCSSSVLHASVVPHGTLIGGSWPCRLFEVSGRPVAEEGTKRGFRKLKVLAEIEPHLALGPQGVQLSSLIGQARALSFAEAKNVNAAWDAARAAARAAAWAADAARDAARAAAWAADAARAAAWAAAWDAARAAARDAAWDAARAAAGLTVRDLINTRQYDILTGAWRVGVGRIHPDDPDMNLDQFIAVVRQAVAK